jgi:FkbM family methyltransferase
MKVADIIKKTMNTLRKQGIGGVIRKTGEHVRRAMRQRTFEPYTIKRVVQGEEVDFYIGDVIGEEWYTNLHADVPELAWLKSNIREGDLAVDCGAHHGMISLLFAKWVGTAGQVVAFEALPTNAEIVRNNVELNGFKHIEVRQQAVGREPGSIRFTLDSNASVARNGSKHTVEVPIVNLDAVFTDRKPDFLKIDVEGHEIEVIRGAKNVMATKPALAIEIHCVMFDEPVKRVSELFKLIDMDSYHSWIQFDYYDEPVAYNPVVHTSEHLIRFNKVNLFAVPKHRDA